MSRQPHSPRFDLPNIWGAVQNMMLLVVQLSPFSCYFIVRILKITVKHKSKNKMIFEDFWDTLYIGQYSYGTAGN
jgi:hypothetical protein